ncbi:MULTISPECIES: type II secretion system protein N [Alcanivorax]|nr:MULTISPECIES: type II secretion system protein N [Alcanivorax]
MMRRGFALGAVFVVSLILFLIVLMPAAVLVERIPQLRPGGAPLTVADARGRWWSGSAAVSWRDQQGRARWEVNWHGLTPGLDLAMVSNDLDVQGWLGAAWGNWRLEQWRASVPVAMVSRYIPQGQADGTVRVTLIALELADDAVVDAKGTLDYSGGTVGWGRGESAPVPPLQGRLSMMETGPSLVVTDPEQKKVVAARVAEQKLNVQVFRAWPQLLGVSQGGDPSDVVFQMSQPFPPGR